MYAGVVAPPLIIGAAVGLQAGQLSLLINASLISASLFTAGLATALQTLGVWLFGARLPLANEQHETRGPGRECLAGF